MKIFNLIIMRKSDYLLKQAKDFGDGFTKGINFYNNYRQQIINELERLKKDHWDKHAFDRIIRLIKNGDMND